MIDLSTQINVGLAQILGMVAVLSAVLMWRMATLETLWNQIDLLQKYRITGYAPSWVDKAYVQRWFELGIGVVSLITSYFVFSETYHYLTLTNVLAEASSTWDFAGLERLRVHAETTKQEALKVGFMSIVVLAFGWLLPLLLHTPSIVPTDIPEKVHPHLIPADWESSPAGLWENRIRETILDSGDAKVRDLLLEAYGSGSWRSHWSKWATASLAFHWHETRSELDTRSGTGEPRTAADAVRIVKDSV